MAGWGHKQATYYMVGYYKRVIGIFGATNPADFPHIVHFSLPIEDFISDPSKCTKALEDIVLALKPLGLNKSDKVVLACNTAHIFQGQLELALNINLVSLLHHTKEALIKLGVTRVGLLASPTTIKSKLFDNILGEEGISVVCLPPEGREQTEAVIRNVIAMSAGAQNKKLINQQIRTLLKQGAQVVILGCTELSTLGIEDNVAVIDPLHEILPALLTVR